MKLFSKILILLVTLAFSSFAGENDSLVAVAGEDVQEYWVTKKVKRPNYPRAAALNGIEGCAAIGFVIESDGSTSSHRPLAAHPSGIFLRSAMDSIKKWKFLPSETNTSKQPVYTYQIIDFSLSPGSKTDFENAVDICTTAANKSFNTDVSKDSKS